LALPGGIETLRQLSSHLQGIVPALEGRLAKFKMPKRVFVVDELPRNTMGKVQKNILRETYKDIYSK
jgi:malonyl-CoA/methylmalonyl-CoA synthetase